MAVKAGSSLVRDGLILCLDSSNRKSYIGAVPTSLINTNSWTVSSGSVSGYSMNGATDENVRSYDTDPWGNQSIVWGSFPVGNNADDGGWNSSYVAINPSKLYRFSVWARRISATSAGTFYLGTGAGGAEVRRTDNSATQGNPYWECSNCGVMTQNQWYLVCGHIYPHDTAVTGRHADTGYFTIAGGTTRAREVNGCNIGQDLKWDPASTTATHRTYHYYCSDATTRLQFAYPRIDLCDGLQPTIADLLTNGASSWNDLSGRGNHHKIQNTPTYTPGEFGLTDPTFFQRSAALTGASALCTVVIWYKTSDTTELWVRGNNDGGRYIAAASGADAYYHGASGSPTYYIDTVARTAPAAYRNNQYHMWEAKNVDFTSWTIYDWFGYTGWSLVGSVAAIFVYNRPLSAAESLQNFEALRGRFGV